jgi:hypothetical protein
MRHCLEVLLLNDSGHADDSDLHIPSPYIATLKNSKQQQHSLNAKPIAK